MYINPCYKSTALNDWLRYIRIICVRSFSSTRRNNSRIWNHSLNVSYHSYSLSAFIQCPKFSVFFSLTGYLKKGINNLLFYISLSRDIETFGETQYVRVIFQYRFYCFLRYRCMLWEVLQFYKCFSWIPLY